MRASELAVNRWPGLLGHFGVAPHLLSGKHVPCPVCEGRDRFRFDDQDGRGTFFCSHCGAGDGFKLLYLVKGWSFKEGAIEIENIVGTMPVREQKVAQNAGDKVETCRRIWRESRTVIVGDPVQQYLARRTGIDTIPSCIRFHPDLIYRHADDSITRHPAMIARVTGIDGQGVAIHRTYLTSDGNKADVPTAKKIVGTLPPSSAVRLFHDGPCISIAEGIETALSAFLLFGVPTWAAVTAGGLEKWTPPLDTKRVIVFGDNDLSGTGQAAAWALARRLIAAGIDTEVKIPETAGTDWNDFSMQQRGGA